MDSGVGSPAGKVDSMLTGLQMESALHPGARVLNVRSSSTMVDTKTTPLFLRIGAVCG